MAHPGQKPVNVRAAEAGGEHYGRRAIWLAFREGGEKAPVDILTLAVKSGANQSTVRTYMENLVRGGYAEKSQNKDRRNVYQLIRDVGVQHPRLNNKGEEIVTSRDSMWRSMKMLPTFTVADLALTGTTSRCVVSVTDAMDYCKHLCNAGYLAVVHAGAPGTGRTVYSLRPHMRTGPLAPMVQRTKMVFDPNRNEVMWHEEIEP